MPTLYRNFLSGTVSVLLSNVGTTLSSAGLSSLPVVTAPDVMWLTLDPNGVDGAPEVVKVTNHTASATTATIVRAQQSTVARQHAITTLWSSGPTQTDLEELVASAAAAAASAAAAQATANAAAPAGTVAATIAAAAPTGWLFHNQTVVGANVTYPALWAVAPASWKSGNNLLIPSLTDRGLSQFGVTALGATGGANSRTIAEANLPAHAHTVNPPITNAVITDPGHNHGVAFKNTAPNVFDATTASAGSFSTMNDAVTGISATVDIAQFNSGSVGSGTALDTTPAHLAVNWMIKAH